MPLTRSFETTLALVPARAGSRGLPGKNLVSVGNRSLVARAVDVARAAGIATIVVSSDSEAILEEGARAGGIPDRRPAALARDDAALEPVIVELLPRHPAFEKMVVLQPTSPLREPDDITRCLLLLEEAATATTVCRVRHPAEWMVRLEGGYLHPLFGWDPFTRRRQELPPSYQLNGAVYAARAAHLLGGGKLLGPHTAGVEMPIERSVDVDEPGDLALARFLIGDDSPPPAPSDE